MSDHPHRPATYDDILNAPEHLVAEILNGRLVTHPRPAPRHSLSGNALGSLLTARFQFGEGGPGGWVFMTEPELHLGDDFAVPDLAGWRLERMPYEPDTAWLDIAPDWICEMLSRSTEKYDRGEKKDIYRRNGVKHYWLADPRIRMLEVCELKDGQYFWFGTFSDAVEVSAPPFAAVPFPLRLIWPLPRKPEAEGA
jgi:Uma2 family endonuclease